MPPSRVKQAAELYREFSGHNPGAVDTLNVEWPTAALRVGKCDGILYETVRDGEVERYIHRFKKSARPELLASHDGAQLALIGGKFRFTDAGITDH